MMSVQSFMVKEKICEFPIDPLEFIQKNKWGLITYTELARMHGVTIPQVINAFQSEDGYTIADEVGYTIAYNDTISNKARIRFTLMHEIGHIYLEHLKEFDETILRRSTLTEPQYRVLEQEVNCFARNVLAPAPIIKKLGLKKEQELVHHFEISFHAAAVRLQFLEWDLKRSLNYLLIQAKDYIYRALNERSCPQCSHYFIQGSAKFCPICGNDALLKRKVVEPVIYHSYTLDENGKPSICPTCENEQIDIEDIFCAICGTELQNRCTRIVDWNQVGYREEPIYCDGKVSGYSRYCTKCGEKTTYFENGLLLPWREEYKDNRKAERRHELELIEEEIEEELEEEREERNREKLRAMATMFSDI